MAKKFIQVFLLDVAENLNRLSDQLYISAWASKVAKNLPANTGNAGDVDSIPALGRSPGGRNGNPLQYSCLGNPMDRGAWWATVHEVGKSQTELSKHINTHTHTLAFAFQFCDSQPRLHSGITWKALKNPKSEPYPSILPSICSYLYLSLSPVCSSVSIIYPSLCIIRLSVHLSIKTMVML